MGGCVEEGGMGGGVSAWGRCGCGSCGRWVAPGSQLHGDGQGRDGGLLGSEGAGREVEGGMAQEVGGSVSWEVLCSAPHKCAALCFRILL